MANSKNVKNGVAKGVGASGKTTVTNMPKPKSIKQGGGQ